MRLIDADELFKTPMGCSRNNGKPLTSLWAYVVDQITHAPTIEAEPVRHSRWFELVESVEDGYTGEYYEEVYYNCLNCDYATGDKTPYCPNCGARMDGDKHD